MTARGGLTIRFDDEDDVDFSDDEESTRPPLDNECCASATNSLQFTLLKLSSNLTFACFKARSNCSRIACSNIGTINARKSNPTRLNAKPKYID